MARRSLSRAMQTRLMRKCFFCAAPGQGEMFAEEAPAGVGSTLEIFPGGGAGPGRWERFAFPGNSAGFWGFSLFPRFPVFFLSSAFPKAPPAPQGGAGRANPGMSWIRPGSFLRWEVKTERKNGIKGRLAPARPAGSDSPPPGGSRTSQRCLISINPSCRYRRLMRVSIN